MDWVSPTIFSKSHEISILDFLDMAIVQGFGRGRFGWRGLEAEGAGGQRGLVCRGASGQRK